MLARMRVSRLVWIGLGVSLFVSTAVFAAPKLKAGGHGPWKPAAFKPEEARKRFGGALSKGKEVLDRDKKKRDEQHKGCGYTDGSGGGGGTEPTCSTPTAATEAQIDIDKSMFVHDRATIDAGGFTLLAVMSQLAEQSVSGGATGVTGESLFGEFWDTQNPGSGSADGNAHCDDNGTQVNGFPVSCRPGEGAQTASPADEMTRYQAIGVVNRLDLAHEGWSNCGEHRIVFGRSDGRRNFMIFEAVLPNPTPGCRSGCRPVAEFWAGLSDPALSATDRGKALHDFYFTGLPGFRPVVHIDHYAAKAVDTTNGSVGSGQIRTNQFLQGPWLLKEFSLALDCGASPCAMQVVPTMVKSNPFGMLWSEEIAGDSTNQFSARAADFQAALSNQVAGLSGKKSGTCPSAGADINTLGYAVSPVHDAAESQPQSGTLPDNFLAAFDPGITPVAGLFRETLQNSPDLCGLTPTQIVNRATTQSCAGCHQPSSFGLQSPGALGNVVMPDGSTASTWPSSLGFVHTLETADSNGVHALSPALTSAFLPARRAFLVKELSADVCSCDRTFTELDTTERDKATKTQTKVDSKFKPRRQKEWHSINDAKRKGRENKKGNWFKEVKQATKRLDDLAREQQAELNKALEKEGVKVSVRSTSLKPHAWKFDAAKRAGGDKKKERELRAQAVIDQLRSEPPRRTVTGQFRVH
jgi:hypothetical protein